VSATSRLAAGAVLAIAGGLTAAVAARAPWASGPPQIITIPALNGFQSANLRVGGSTAPGTDVGALATAVCGLAVVVLAVFGVLARGRSRRPMFVAAGVLAALAIGSGVRAAVGARVHAEMLGFRHPSVNVVSIIVTIAAAIAAGVGAVLAVQAAGAASPTRLPEAAPGVATRATPEPEGFDD